MLSQELCKELIETIKTIDKENVMIATIERLYKEKLMLAKLASATPKFDNPVDFAEAVHIRNTTLENISNSNEH